MLKAADAALIVNVDNSIHEWCVWEHHAVLTEGSPPTLIMVGACKLSEAFNLLDGKSNSEWQKIFQREGCEVMVRIVATSSEKSLCYHHAQQLVRDRAPVCNIRGVNLKHSRQSILCITTGKVYNSQTEACKDLGIAQSALSRHLTGKQQQVQGFTFRYQEPTRTGEPT